MKKLLLIFVFACSVQIPFAQVILPVGPATIDSLKAELKKTSNDTLRLVLVNELRFNYFFGKGDFDSALVYSKQVLGLAQKMGYKIDEAYAYDLLADIFNFQHHDQTLETFFRGIKIAEDPRSEKKILPRKYLEKMTYWHKDFNALLVKNNWSTGYFRLAILGSLYQDLGRAYGKVMPDQQKLFFYLTKAINLYTSQKDSAGLIHTYSNIAEYFYARDQLDSSLSYIQKADALQQLYTRSSQLFLLYPLWGTLHFRKGNYPLSLRLLRQSITPGNEFEKGWNWLAYVTLAEYFLKTGQLDSSLYYGREAHILTTKTNLPDTRQTTSALLARLYESTGARDSALEYYKLALSLNDSVNNFSKRAQLQRQDFEQQRQQDELEQEKARVKSYALLAGLAILLTIALFLLRNNQQRKKQIPRCTKRMAK
jgi:tetratricopeptide (TPR) repeat protein